MRGKIRMKAAIIGFQVNAEAKRAEVIGFYAESK